METIQNQITDLNTQFKSGHIDYTNYMLQYDRLARQLQNQY